MKFILRVGTIDQLARDYSKRTFEIDDEDLEGLEDDERAAVIEEVGRDVMLDTIAWDWEEA